MFVWKRRDCVWVTVPVYNPFRSGTATHTTKIGHSRLPGIIEETPRSVGAPYYIVCTAGGERVQARAEELTPNIDANPEQVIDYITNGRCVSETQMSSALETFTKQYERRHSRS